MVNKQAGRRGEKLEIPLNFFFPPRGSPPPPFDPPPFDPPVPEPATLTLLGMGIGGMLLSKMRKTT